jgi:hypothetical protein
VNTQKMFLFPLGTAAIKLYFMRDGKALSQI